MDAVASANQAYKDLRFAKISEVFAQDRELSLHEIGCGLGHYYEFLKKHEQDKEIVYSGSDVTEAFVSACREAYPECSFALRDILTEEPSDRYDYVVLPGVFYHLAGVEPAVYYEYVKSMLRMAYSMCKRGMAVNLITKQCEFFREDLFYCQAGEMLDFALRELSRFAAIDHSYALYEFTLRVYAPQYIEAQHPDPAFAKYFRRSGRTAGA